MTPQGGLPYPPHWQSLPPATLGDRVLFCFVIAFCVEYQSCPWNFYSRRTRALFISFTSIAPASWKYTTWVVDTQYKFAGWKESSLQVLVHTGRHIIDSSWPLGARGIGWLWCFCSTKTWLQAFQQFQSLIKKALHRKFIHGFQGPMKPLEFYAYFSGEKGIIFLAFPVGWAALAEADSAALKHTPGQPHFPSPPGHLRPGSEQGAKQVLLSGFMVFVIDHIGKRYLKLLKFLRHLSKDT